MSKTPFMPLWVADFLAKTSTLEAKEVGAYMLLLMSMWSHDGTLPADQKKLQRVARCGRDWPKIWDAIGHYFDEADGVITNRRLSEELQKVATKREVNSQHGSLGGKAKARKTNNADLANANVSLQRNPSIPEPEPEPEESNSVADATDGEAVDPAKAVWDAGVRVLGASGVSDRQARSFVGKLRKDHPGQDSQILSAIMDCGRAGAVDPIPWITAHLRPSKQPDLAAIFAKLEAESRQQ